jgi:hypothetical protein
MKNLAYIIAGLSLGAAAVLTAQTTTTADTTGPRRSHGPGHGGPGGPGRGGHPIVRALDTDKNRELSAEEIANAPATLRALDRNNDGSVSFADLRPDRPADAPERPARKQRPDGDTMTERGSGRGRLVDPVMLALDANGDRALSAAEIANAAASLKALDANSDGKLTPDELRPLPPSKE